MEVLQKRGWVDALKAYVRADKPYLGICLGMQTLFEASEESPGVGGLGLLPGNIERFVSVGGRAVPQIGWNTLQAPQPSSLLEGVADRRRLLCALVPRRAHQGARAVGADRNRLRRAVHLERAARPGDGVPIPPREIGRGRPQDAPQLCDVRAIGRRSPPPPLPKSRLSGPTRYCKRIIACMDVRANDQGDLVCTKGDQYDVRERRMTVRRAATCATWASRSR